MHIIKQYISFEKILLWLLFYISPFIDSISGYMLKIGTISEGGLFSPSQLYRFFLFGIFFIYSFSNIKRNIGYKFILFIALMILYESIIGVIFSSALYHIFFGYSYILKISYLIILYLAINKMIEKRRVLIQSLLDYIMISGLICISLIYLTKLMNIDMPTYTDGTFGSKGLFPSGNGISLYIGAVSLLCLIKLNMEYNINYIIFSIILICSNLLIGTKASMIFLFIDLLYVLFYIVMRYNRLFFILLSLIYIVLFINYIYIFNNFFDVIIFRFEHSENIFTFLASNRDNYVVDAFKEYNLQGLLAIRILIGLGAFISYRDPFNQNIFFDTLETDFFDIFFMYGIIGLSIYLSICFYILYDAYKNKSSGLFIFSFFILIYSLVSGHCLFNAFSGVLVVYAKITSKHKLMKSYPVKI